MKKIFIFFAFIFYSMFALSQPDFRNKLINNTNGTIRVIGNPANGVINIQMSSVNNIKYDLSLYSVNGQKVTSLSFVHQAGVSIEKMNIPAGVSGMYFLVITSLNERRSIRVFVQ